ncbi:hypothetical protein CNBC4710 [Cryptococcus deneoformans B-3501A]|uniref:hypothetical protein n=1 Tax=Cryptococcus deneoformans (strain B-3501A) TaxID=283643 RepID=UPI000042F709|nr:hypothetical protein CNBC4710 [Cryptococcus neoformans var. neoformans B-3501A]EAL21769.1 hypothetical protein CNBC4710 [Cryptococcus neoformans var. neoformans B-3501A]
MPRKQAPQQSYAPPLPHSHSLVQLGAPQGSNNFLCKDALGEERLVEISKSLKRMKGLIVMRGDYAVIRLFPTAPEESVRLVGEIVYILEKGDVKEWKRAGEWPPGFSADVLPSHPTEEKQATLETGEGEEADQSDDGRQSE